MKVTEGGGFYRAQSMMAERDKCHLPRCVVAVVTDALAGDSLWPWDIMWGGRLGRPIADP